MWATLLTNRVLFAIFSVGLGYSPFLPYQQLPIPVGEFIGAENTCGASVLGTVAVDVIDRSPVVTVLANGVPLRLLLDTGAQRSTIIEAAARQIGARTPRVQFQRGLHSVAAAMPTREAELDSFSIAKIQIPSPRLTVAQITIPHLGPTGLDGVLGADILDRFDTDFDPVRGRVALYPRGACATGKPNWATVEIGAGRSAYTIICFSEPN